MAHQRGSTARQWAAPSTDVDAHITVMQSGKFHSHSSSGTCFADTEDRQY